MWDVGKCHQDKYLSSTEVYRGGRWVTVGPLPLAVDGVRGVTLDNTVFMTGQLVFYLHSLYRTMLMDKLEDKWLKNQGLEISANGSENVTIYQAK